MIRIVIADDEQLAREKLTRQLVNNDDVELVGVALDGEQAIEMVNQLQPDLVILDINMPKLSGMQIVEKFDCEVQVIFATAYDEFAIEAFEKAAADYLLKPYSFSRLQQSLQRAAKFIRLSEQKDAKALIENGETPALEKLTAKVGDKTVLFPVSEVVAVKSENGITWANVLQAGSNKLREYAIDASLDELNDILPPFFVRAHRNSLVNMHHIKQVQKWFNSNLLLKFADPKFSISTSRSGTQRIKQSLKF